MGPFVVEFYETRDGQRPAEDFLDELDIKMRSKLVMTLKVLQEQGNRLRSHTASIWMMEFLRSAEKLERIFRGSCISSIMGEGSF